MDWSLFSKATFSDWIYTGVFADISERGGFEKSELLEDSSEDVPSAGVEEWAGMELFPSAVRLGEMQRVLIPTVKCGIRISCRVGAVCWTSLTCSRYKRTGCISNLSTGRRSRISSCTGKREGSKHFYLFCRFLPVNLWLSMFLSRPDKVHVLSADT